MPAGLLSVNTAKKFDREIDAGIYTGDDNIIFWHTGGGFAAFAHDFSRIVAAEDRAARNA